MTEYSPELIEALQSMPHVKEVHFTADGDHYFNAHVLKGKKIAAGKEVVSTIASSEITGELPIKKGKKKSE